MLVWQGFQTFDLPLSLSVHVSCSLGYHDPGPYSYPEHLNLKMSTNLTNVLQVLDVISDVKTNLMGIFATVNVVNTAWC